MLVKMDFFEAPQRTLVISANLSACRMKRWTDIYEQHSFKCYVKLNAFLTEVSVYFIRR